MQRTEKYFENDAFRKIAAGVILAAEADAKTGGGRIALDGTVFYPEGGGQPADRGTLTLADGTVLNVTDVHETNGIIWHRVDAMPEAAQPGAAVTSTIDWEWRFDKMQQHTGEHILSGILHQMFGAENVGFHIGSEAVRMGHQRAHFCRGPAGSRACRQPHRVAGCAGTGQLPHPGGACRPCLPLQKGDRRAGAHRDHSRCGCLRLLRHPHPHHRTGGTDQNSGQRELQGRRAAERGVRPAGIACCTGHAPAAGRDRGAALGQGRPDRCAVHRVYDEYTALKFTHFGVCSQLFDALAQLANPGEDAIRTVPGLDPDGLHRLAVRLTEATTGLCAALTPTEKGTGYCIAQADGDVRALTKALNAALNGRGGGKPGICQGSCAAAPEQVEEFLREQNR